MEIVLSDDEESVQDGADSASPFEFKMTVEYLTKSGRILAEDDSKVQRGIKETTELRGKEALGLLAKADRFVRERGFRQVVIPAYGNCLYEALSCALEPGHVDGASGIVINEEKLRESGTNLRCACLHFLPC